MPKESCPWCESDLEYKHYSLNEVYKRCTNADDCTYAKKVVKEDENNK